jgi:hypothetical protein
MDKDASIESRRHFYNRDGRRAKAIGLGALPGNDDLATFG